MSQRLDRLRILLVVLTFAASAAVGFAQTTTRGTASPEREAAPMASLPATAEPAGAAQAEPRKPRYPVVKDARLTASPKERYLGPPGTTSPFDSTNMTENQCRDMERCQVVQGQGPSYATWCRCGKGKLTTFTYIHD
jgi:hypothetical protein